MIMKKVSLYALLVMTLVLGISSVAPHKASALSGSSFQAGDIIYDGIFFNASTMSATDIQNFLNSKVPSCDTNGTQPSGEPGYATRADWGAANGAPAPYTCLKDYSQAFNSTAADAYCGAVSGGTESSANIIFNVSHACGINPEVMIVLLQKEQGLVTDDWPWPTEYRSATGYGCPDTAACDSTYYGFFNQVYNAAHQFKRYIEQPQNFNFAAGRASSIQYNPNSACSSSVVNIQDDATAALYNYTPYQPNQAALNNLYGTGDSCSSYGNRNFWRYFNDWFGPTLGINSSYFAVLQDPDGSGRWYLAVNGAKHYIPSNLYYVWGLNNYPVENVSQTFFDSFPTYGNIGRLLKDEWQNYFFIDNGSVHYIRNSNLFAIWGLDPNTAVQSTGLVSALSNGGNWIGRFMTDDNGTTIYVMDGGEKHLVPSNSSLLYQWGYTSDQRTNVSSDFLNSLPDGGPVTQYVSFGGRDFIIDSGRVLYFGNSDVESAYGTQTYMAMNNLMTLSLLPIQKVSTFVTNQSGSNWYMLEGGTEHYIPNLAIATAWGYAPGQALTNLSNPLMSTLNTGGNLSYLVQTTPSGGGSLLWAVDGNSHYLPTQAVASAWIPSSVTLPIYSSQSIDTLQRGADLTTLMQANASPYVYTLDNGTKRYLALSSLVNAWGSPSFTTVSKLNANLVTSISEASPISVVVQNSGTYYLLVNGTAYPINPTYADSWRANSSTPQIANSTLARFTVSSQQVGAFIKVGTTYYIMNNLFAIPVSKYLDAYGINGSNSVTLPYNYFSTLPGASYLVKSTAAGDSRIWLVNNGSKILLTPAQAIDYGYISQGVNPTALSPAVLSAIPDSSTVPSLLVTTPGEGVKLLSFGYALGFPDGSTLNSYVSSTNPIDTLSSSIYNQFALKKTASILVRDDSNNIYLIQNGTKRLIQNQSTIASSYPGVPIVYLESTAIVSIPTGAPI
jgi:hypothetical protein